MKKVSSKGFGTLEIILLIVLVGLLAGAGWFVWNRNQNQKLDSISTFAECKTDKGSLIQESYPEVCVTKNGKHFTNPDQKVNLPESSNNSNPKVDENKYLTIKEWDVRFKLSDDIEDAYYYINKANPSYAYLSVKSLVKVAPQCAPDKTSLGAIYKHTKAVHEAAVAEQEQHGAHSSTSNSLKLINNYYYGFISPQAGCFDSSNTAAVKKLDEGGLIEELRKATLAVEAVPNN